MMLVTLLLFSVHLGVLVAQPVPEACCFGNGHVAYGRDCYESFPPVTSWDDVQKCWQLGAHHFGNKSSAEQYQIFSIFLGSESSSGLTKRRRSNDTIAHRYNTEIPQIAGNGSTLVMDSSVVASKLSPIEPMLPLFIQFVFPVEENSGTQTAHYQRTTYPFNNSSNDKYRHNSNRKDTDCLTHCVNNLHVPKGFRTDHL